MNAQSSDIQTYLKSHDPDRYFSSLVLGGEAANGVRALYAFAAEISQTRERVSDPAIGEIRLQYWFDLLSGTEYGQTSDNPLAYGLMQTIDLYNLPTGPLRRLIEARRFDLYDDPMADIPTFEGYAGETNSVLYQLATMIINGGNDAGAADAAGHLGVAHALIGNLRSLAIVAARGQILLPWSVFIAHGADENDYLAGKATQPIIAGCAALRQNAAEHLNLAQAAITKLLPEIRPVFAQTGILHQQLIQLEKFDTVPFICPPDMANWQKIAKVFWWSVKNR